MIFLTRGQANTVAVTLYEKTTLPYDTVQYLFEFKNDQTNVSSYCIPTDTSDFINRYNLFSIVETSSPDPLAGEVELDKGEYHYFVYEQLSTTNLDPTGLTLVESGIVRVYTAPTADTIYQNTSTNYQVYNGGK